ncbi:hypothetical protein ACE1CD_15625 [Aerosakkonema sp. BLCC-F183]|uniref:hypothetical protein n=1 Tax=Aerosakkonema sp. BLCC-F183 TaxID=3342834 RepID=UPI0035B8853D
MEKSNAIEEMTNAVDKLNSAFKRFKELEKLVYESYTHFEESQKLAPQKNQFQYLVVCAEIKFGYYCLGAAIQNMNIAFEQSAIKKIIKAGNYNKDL